MDSAIIMEYKHKETNKYINIGMEKFNKIKNKIFKMCRQCTVD